MKAVVSEKLQSFQEFKKLIIKLCCPNSLVNIIINIELYVWRVIDGLSNKFRPFGISLNWIGALEKKKYERSFV